MSKAVLYASLVTLMSASSAFALQASKTVQIAAPPAKVWAAIGDFCGIAQWHPAIEACAPSMKGKTMVRTLSLKGGGTIVEEQLSRSDKKMAYSYAILSSPLPVSHYKSKIAVVADGAGSKVTWSGTFKAKGADDAAATNAIQGIYDSGLAALADKAK